MLGLLSWNFGPDPHEQLGPRVRKRQLVDAVGLARLPLLSSAEVHADEDLGQDHLDFADGPEPTRACATAMAEEEVVLMGLYHLGLLAVEAVAVEDVWGRVHLSVEVDGCAGKADASAFGQDGTVLEGDRLEYSALRGHCVEWVCGSMLRVPGCWRR